MRPSVTFLVNVSPAIQLDVPTSKFVAVLHCSHDLEGRVTLAPIFFLVNVSTPKPFDVATLNFADA